MAKTRLLPLCGLAAGSAYVSITIPTSFAIDRPLHSLAILLLASSLAVGAYCKYIEPDPRTPDEDRYNKAIPLGDWSELHNEGHLSAGLVGIGTHGLRAQWRMALAAVVLTLLTCARAAIVWTTTKHVECAKSTNLGHVPLVIALLHAYRKHTPGPPSQAQDSRGPKALLEHGLFCAMHGSTRYILPALLLVVSSSEASKAISLPSTCICPNTSVLAWVIPKLSFIGILVDCTTAVIAWYLLEYPPTGGVNRFKGVLDGRVLIAYSFFASFIGLVVAGVIAYFIYPEHRVWMFELCPEYTRSLASLTIATLVTVLAFLHAARYFGAACSSILSGNAFLYAIVFHTLLTTPSQPFPPWSISTLTVLIITPLMASNLLFEGDLPEQSSTRYFAFHRNRRFRGALPLFVLITAFYFFQHRRSVIQGHPIDTLIDVAIYQHDGWIQQAHRSSSLDEAISNYQQRYQRSPPPGFDQWYDFASNRGSMVIDDFDNIEEDLAPFVSLSPSELRKRTTEVLADNRGLGGISIRQGKGEVFSNVPGTHRWSMDAVVRMIEPFVANLPDMDIAINLNDESRVAVPFDALHNALTRRDSTPALTNASSFSSDRASTWPKIDELSSFPPYFTELGFNPTFQSYGSISCESSSRARTERHWNTALLCTACAAPHSLGIFVRDWSFSASPCHQPDLANLHGFYLSPSSLIGSHKLVPVFSQSKALGYSDIRFPSPWNYVDKARYEFDEEFPDMPFEQKENTLFWRGATSEGVSAGNGVWKGMLRQRLVHIGVKQANPQVILLPSGKGNGGFEYTVQSSLIIGQNLLTKLDVGFVPPVVRCGGMDCPAQSEELNFVEPVDFKQHWRYKYLFDADGAGFSGRFIPFLQSNSLVFKSALFREWYEGRLIAWHDFVPLDLRLHDLWSIMAYFGGWKGQGGSRTWPARDEQAEKIATQGKEWSNKLLRKEDMEIYMYRLLLEWAWLTDDQRGMNKRSD